MRLWLLHPKYLDCKGLVAVWREGLLARKVLEGKTKGYTNHPQLTIFRRYERPIDLINAYLFQIYLEARRRVYAFDASKIEHISIEKTISIRREELEEEFRLLKQKVRMRDRKKFEELKSLDSKRLEPNPVFLVDEERR